MPNFIIDEYQRNVLLEYMEQREDVRDGDDGRQEPNAEMYLASLLRDLKPLRQVSPTISEHDLDMAKVQHLNASLNLIENALFGGRK